MLPRTDGEFGADRSDVGVPGVDRGVELDRFFVDVDVDVGLPARLPTEADLVCGGGVEFALVDVVIFVVVADFGLEPDLPVLDVDDDISLQKELSRVAARLWPLRTSGWLGLSQELRFDVVERPEVGGALKGVIREAEADVGLP